jgi:RNA polymerase sigma factor (sigma-70 family)
MSPLALSIRFLKTQPDSKLIELARGGHERAFEALVQRYRRPLLRYCRRLSTSDGAAEDALQQALLQAWVALGSAETTIRDARAWLYRIVHNVAISNLRRPVHDGAYLDLPQGISGADHEVERRLEVRDALAGLASLPEMQRRVMLSTALEGRSHDEIADALGLSHGAVRGLIYRARATLRAAAAALTPSPLLHWAARQEIAAGGRSAGIYEAVVGGGSAGLGGALFKGGALVVSAGALATATGLTGSHSSHHSHRHGAGARRLASEAGPAGLSASSRAAGSTRIEASQVIGAGRGRGASGFGSSGEPSGSGGPSGQGRSSGSGGSRGGHGGRHHEHVGVVFGPSPGGRGRSRGQGGSESGSGSRSAPGSHEGRHGSGGGSDGAHGSGRSGSGSLEGSGRSGLGEPASGSASSGSGASGSGHSGSGGRNDGGLSAGDHSSGTDGGSVGGPTSSLISGGGHGDGGPAVVTATSSTMTGEGSRDASVGGGSHGSPSTATTITGTTTTTTSAAGSGH